MSYIVALTGGIGSGKSTVANEFARLGVPIIDADVIARQVVEKDSPALQDIANHFGKEILLADGSLNRRLLRKKTFSDPQQKAWLNALLHPLIQRETLQQFANTTTPYLIWVIPLLMENRLTWLANRIVVVDILPELQLTRAMQRDGSDRQVIQNIIDSQISRQERLAYADDIIDNNLDPNTLPERVMALHQRYLATANWLLHEEKGHH